MRKEMLNVTLNGFGGPEVLELTRTAIPSPKDSEILIKVHAAGVNRPDLSQREGKYPPPPGASPILGLEVSGVVAQAAAGSRWKTGDRVCALAPGGGYAEYCVVPSENALPIPEGMSFEEAAGVPETYFTVWANVFQIAALKNGERFLVHGGSSGIGTTAIQLARAFGAEVYATAGSDEKCAACVKLGAKLAVNYRTQAFEESITHATGGQGVNVILDMVGGPYTERNIEALATGGRLVQIATQKGAKVNVNLMKIMQKRLTLTGSTLRPRSVEDKARIARELEAQVWPLLASRRVHVVVDRVFPFSQVREAHRYLEGGTHIGKVILRME